MKRKFSAVVLALCLVLLSSAAWAKVNIRMAIQNAENSWGCVAAINPWIKAVSEVTNGEVTIEPFYNNTLANSRDAWNATKIGIADMAWCVQGYWPGQTPVVEVVTMPGLPFEFSETASAAAYQLLLEFPEIAAEFKDFQPLIFHADPHVLMMAKKKITSPDDLSGLKIRVLGGPPTTQFRMLKASPILMPMPDVYMSLQKGVLDGMDVAWEASLAHRFYELIDYYLEVPLAPSLNTVLMNKAKWNSIPAEARDAIMSISGVNGSAKWGKAWSDAAKEEVVKQAQDKKPNFMVYALDDAALEKWNQVSVNPVHEEWVSAMEKKGVTSASAILTRCIELGELSLSK